MNKDIAHLGATESESEFSDGYEPEEICAECSGRGGHFKDCPQVEEEN